jgi:hypothetical protein
MSFRMFTPSTASQPRLLVIALVACLASGCRSSGSHVESETGRSNTTSLEAGRVTTLKGAWRVVETAVRTPGQAWDVRAAPQGGIFVFSEGHYSYFYLRGSEPRPRFKDANRPSDAERAATYDTFIAGAGSYTFDGRTALLKSEFRKNPNEMTGAIWRYETEAAGDTIRFVFANPPFLPGRDWRLTVVRVD